MTFFIKKSFWVLLLGLLISCQHTCDDEMKPPEPPVECAISADFPLEIVWSSLLRSDSSRGGSISPVIYYEDILFNNGKLGIVNTIYSLSPENGSRQWEWDQFLEPPGDFVNIKSPNLTQAFDNKFYFDHGSHKMLLDVSTQQLIWATDTGFSESEQVCIGDYLYYVGFVSNGNEIQSSQLFRLHKDSTTDEWELIYELQGGHILGVPALWINPNGDEILISKSSTLSPTRTHLVGYNVTQQMQEFLLSDFTEFHKRKFPPIIDDNKAFLPLSGGITCIDLISYQVIWETKDLGINFFIDSNPILKDEVIIIHSEENIIYAFEIATGQIVWQNTNAGKFTTNITHYKGGLYFGGSENFDDFLFGVDFKTGELFLKMESPYDDCFNSLSMRGFLSIDQESGRLYTTDGMFAYCFQLDPR